MVVKVHMIPLQGRQGIHFSDDLICLFRFIHTEQKGIPSFKFLFFFFSFESEIFRTFVSEVKAKFARLQLQKNHGLS